VLYIQRTRKLSQALRRLEAQGERLVRHVFLASDLRDIAFPKGRKPGIGASVDDADFRDADCEKDRVKYWQIWGGHTTSGTQVNAKESRQREFKVLFTSAL
jgi:hypothetical protein